MASAITADLANFRATPGTGVHVKVGSLGALDPHFREIVNRAETTALRLLWIHF